MSALGGRREREKLSGALDGNARQMTAAGDELVVERPGGKITGMVYSVPLAFANPCGMGGLASNGLRAMEGAQALGGAINAGENIAEGNYGAAGLDMAGSLLGARGMTRVCFAAGTPLLTPTGGKPIEQFKPGDLLLSRSEFDPDGPLHPKPVEEVFVRVGLILHVHIGGQVIRTTAQHPFFVQRKGWVEGGDLKIGDLLLSHDGRWVPVEDLFDTGEYETVYNLAIADYHTYFVGNYSWGFSVWAHNDNKCVGQNLNNNNAKSNFGIYEIWVKAKDKWDLFKVGKADLNRVTKSSGWATRIHQQVRKLKEIFGKGNVKPKLIEDLGETTTREAKLAEKARLDKICKTGPVPSGNPSYKPPQ